MFCSFYENGLAGQIGIQDGSHFKSGTVQKNPLVRLAYFQNITDVFARDTFDVPKQHDLPLGCGQTINGFFNGFPTFFGKERPFRRVRFPRLRGRQPVPFSVPMGDKQRIFKGGAFIRITGCP